MSSPSTKPIADLSIDMDNEWSYIKTHGDENWESYPSYLPFIVPKILDILSDLDLKITFMVVGKDATIEENVAPLKSIAAAGHEIGNHSFKHETWLQRYCWGDLVEELEAAEEALRKITDSDIVGFRGPGYSLSSDILDWLSKHNYVYDASTFPTYLGPISRLYYFFSSRLTTDEKVVRSSLFGSFADGFRRIRPYKWHTNFGEILEIPVSTMPIFRVPIHFTYIHYLAQFSPLIAKMYFRWSLLLCKLTRFSPSLLMHPLDFMGSDEVSSLDYFPGMKRSGEQKRKLMRELLTTLGKSYRLVPMRDRADYLLTQQDSKLPERLAQLISV